MSERDSTFEEGQVPMEEFKGRTESPNREGEDTSRAASPESTEVASPDPERVELLINLVMFLMEMRTMLLNKFESL